METTRAYTALESPTDHQPDEHELIVRAGKDDKEAFGKLYALYVSDVQQQVRSNVDNEDTAEDVAQEAFVRVYEHIGTFEDQGRGIRPYAGRIAKNLCVDRARRAQRRPRVTDNEEQRDAAFAALSAPDNTEQQALHALEPFSPEVQNALDELKDHNPDFYQAAIAVWVRGKMYREYAEEAGLPINTVRTQVHRAKQVLHENLKSHH